MKDKTYSDPSEGSNISNIDEQDAALDLFNSKAVDSNQPGIHENLEALVNKHVKTQYKKPYQIHNLAAFDQLKLFISETAHSGLILDSCCGTGLSSIQIARQNPDKLVIGVDQSEHRLSKSMDKLPKNVLLLQANCEDIWRLCAEDKIRFDQHFILYPNPWPKSVHVKRRWHGHAVFPVLAKISSCVEVRSNWGLYLEEFSYAWSILTSKTSDVQSLVVENPLTLFERKYHGSGQKLYRLVCHT